MLKRGEGWERRLMRQHEEYRRARRALILRAHPEVRIVHRAGAVVSGRLAGEGPPDFVGLLYAHGSCPAVPIVAEAKCTQGGILPWAMLPRHQTMALEACALGGGRALIFAEIAGAGWLLDWTPLSARWWAWAEAPTRWADSGYRPGQDGGRPFAGADWLEALT